MIREQVIALRNQHERESEEGHLYFKQRKEQSEQQFQSLLALQRIAEVGYGKKALQKNTQLAAKNDKIKLLAKVAFSLLSAKFVLVCSTDYEMVCLLPDMSPMIPFIIQCIFFSG